MQRNMIIHLYGRMHKLFFQRMSEQCQSAQLHPGQVPLFKSLRAMAPCSQAQLSQMLNVSPSAVAVSLKRLEKQGMIVRHTNPKSQRENVISLTEKGETESALIDNAFQDVLEKALNGINESETMVLAQILEKICVNLEPLKNKEKKDQDAETV